MPGVQPQRRAISRAGSATVSELAALGIPAVFVPYAVGNGEQALNAASAVDAGAARLVADAEFTADRVRTEIVPLLTDDDPAAILEEAAAESNVIIEEYNLLNAP